MLIMLVVVSFQKEDQSANLWSILNNYVFSRIQETFYFQGGTEFYGKKVITPTSCTRMHSISYPPFFFEWVH